MMARDEEAIIGRAAASARGLVDSWLLLDTGSRTDAQATALQDALYGVPGEVCRTTWVDFGEGRTAALSAAQGQAEWLLMLDADQTVEASPKLHDWLNGPHEVDGFDVQLTGSDRDRWYQLPRLLRGDLDWRYVGPTHEYLDTDGRRFRSLYRESLTLVNHDDGAHQPVKHQRDLDLLAAAAEAGDPRATYYAAQALWCLGRVEEAAAMYERRARLGGWEEEAWHAAYMAARLREDVPGLLAAYQRRPHRAEPLDHAARILRSRGTTDKLFVEDPAGNAPPPLRR